MHLSIILPAHNEGARLSRCVERVVRTCAAITNDYEVIIAEDGSTDSTYDIARKLAKGSGRIRLLHSDERLGRGEALARALRTARGDIAVYMDIDLATDLKHLRALVGEVEKGAAIATGSRYAPGARASRTLLRDVASRGYNLLARLLLGSRVSDHQAGFKAFDLRQVLPWLHEVEDKHWFWDTEILVRAQRKGLRIAEVPIEWREGRSSTVKLRNDILYMGWKLLELRRKLAGARR